MILESGIALLPEMGGPEMAPQTPQRSSLPGGAGARLDLAPHAWAPKWPTTFGAPWPSRGTP